MTSKIRVLDELAINKIAAGEVIENPASVVKELIENSLDAGSSEIKVEIKAGGRQLIRVTDNGLGMSKDDALLCFERHATSKIKTLEDIYALTTMGFRGEALPSIAAVSKVSLKTALKTSDENLSSKATAVLIEGGKILECLEATRPAGTTIEVRELFYNVPVRKKFQKSLSQDSAEIYKTFQALALGNPTIHFELINESGSSEVFPVSSKATFKENLSCRIIDIFGNHFFKGLIGVERSFGDYRLKGFIGAPAQHRPNRMGQYLFINQRAVTSSLLSWAVREGYGELIPNKRFPVFVLHLELPAECIDVNVHPQKKEVRFKDENQLKELIFATIFSGLEGSYGAALEEGKIETFSTASEPFKFDRASLKERIFPGENLREMPKASLLEKGSQVATKIEPNFFIEREIEPRILGQIENYILVDAKSIARQLSTLNLQGILVIDQRAAHFRVIFERLEDILKDEAPSSSVETQALLFPEVIELSKEKSRSLQENLTTLNKLGIGIREFGNNSFVVDTIPPLLANGEAKAFVLEMLELLEEEPLQHSWDKNKMSRLIMATSYAAIDRKKILEEVEVKALVKALFKCRIPQYCPKGKPTLICLTLEELQKRFK